MRWIFMGLLAGMVWGCDSPPSSGPGGDTPPGAAQADPDVAIGASEPSDSDGSQPLADASSEDAAVAVEAGSPDSGSIVADTKADDVSAPPDTKDAEPDGGAPPDIQQGDTGSIPPDGFEDASLDVAEPTTDASDGDPDSSAPTPPCGECEPDSRGCLDEKTYWVCTSAAAPGGPGPDCWVRSIEQTCAESVCAGGASCTCQGGDAVTVCNDGFCEGLGPVCLGEGEAPDRLCFGGGLDSSIYEVTDEDQQLVETCPNPGCWLGTCQPELARATMLWPQPTPATLTAIAVLGEGHVLVAGQSGAVYEYDGAEWKDARPLDSWYPEPVYLGRDAGGEVALLFNGLMLQWNGGVNWDSTLLPTGPTKPWVLAHTSAWMFDDGAVTIGTSGGFLLQVDSGQQTWVDLGLPSSNTPSVRSVWGTSSSDVWAVGESGLARHFDGSKWAPVPGLSAESGGVKSDLDVVRGTSDGEVFVLSGTTLHRRVGSEWDPIFAAPEAGEPHSLWVGGPSDIWVAGPYVLSHFDGVEWTSQSTGFEGSVAQVRAIACGEPGDCWAVGGAGLVLHLSGANWTMVSKGQDELGSTLAETSSVWAASPNVVFEALRLSKSGATAWLRRLLIEDGEVVDVDTWDMGKGSYYPWAGVRGLWGTAPDNVFAATAEPMHFDGESWQPLDPVLSGYSAVTLAGRGDDLYVSLIRMDPLDRAIAHRQASGGPWSFVHYEGAEITDLWIDDNGTLYGSNGIGVSTIHSDGSLGFVMGAWELEAYIAVSHTNEVLYLGSEILLRTPLGEVVTPHVTVGYGDQSVGVALPPSGPGFLTAIGGTIGELGTHGVVSSTSKATDFKPYAYEQVVRSIHLSPWGDLYLGLYGGGVSVMPGPWKAPPAP